MIHLTFTYDKLAEIVEHHLKPLVKKFSIFTFTGPLGVGKTTLVKEILRQCGVQGLITSPTFSYVNTYHAGPNTFNHFDLYRITSPDQFIDAGFGELLVEKGSVNFIEWPEVIAEIIKQDQNNKQVCHIVLKYDLQTSEIRHIQFNDQILSQ